MKKADDVKLAQLSQFTKRSNKMKWRSGNQVVSYTRVSDHSQFDNTSLETQRKDLEIYAKKREYVIKKYFGGVVESAKTDQRTEFKKMLDYIRKDKSICAILVYSYERFSRSDYAATLSRELTKIGVKVLSVFQDVDVTTASGQLQQDIFYAFGNYDNVLRRDKTTRGMIENLRNGYWVCQAPFGYSNLNRKEKAKYHKYIINEDGELLKLGFKWKAEGKLSNLEIVAKMRKMGSSISYKSFVRIISNPFYCGYITHSLIPGEVINGKHPALISESLFLKANNVITTNPHKGIAKKFKNEDLPLKSFLKDDLSKTPFTGYIKKGIYYYKTRGKGNAVNERADFVNQLFIKELEKYSIPVNYHQKLEAYVLKIVEEKFNEQIKEVAAKKKRITELTTKNENLELRYIENEIDKELYEKFSTLFKKEREVIKEEIEKNNFTSSNLETAIKKAFKFLQNPLQLWASSDYDDKQRLQYLMFPEGIWYNKINKAVRTPRVNSVFACIAYSARVLSENENGCSIKNSHHSHFVVPTRIELVSKV